MTQIISGFDEISGNYGAAFVDLWGCMHNGVHGLPSAISAMQKYRANGGVVVLLTNSPRPRSQVEKQIAHFGIPDDAWDTIASSGDSARAAMFTGAVGENVYFIGDDVDQAFFNPLNLLDKPINITQVPLSEADGIVCCGPADTLADPSAYRADFLYAKQKGLKLLCANPDIVVDRGERREYCAGALAALYTEIGGESLYFGKPFPPIYDLARMRLSALNKAPSDPRIIAIGDGIRTDILGAIQEDIDSLFISGGLAAAETKTTVQPDPEALNTYLQTEMSAPNYTIGHLR